MASEIELLSASRQIELQKTGQEVRARRIVEIRIGNAKLEGFGQERVRELHAELGVVFSLNIRQIRLNAGVIQTARLAKGHCLIGERIGAGEVFHVVETVIRIN